MSVSNKSPEAMKRVSTSNSSKPELHICFDVEATGESVSNGSCVQLALVLCCPDITYSTFPAFIETFVKRAEEEGDKQSEVITTLLSKTQFVWSFPDTRGVNRKTWDEFWLKNKNTWEQLRKKLTEPWDAMKELSDLLKLMSENYKIVWVASPAAYDWQWLKDLYETYGPMDKHPLGFKADCFSSYKKVVALLGEEVLQKYENAIKVVNPNPHDALYDAIATMESYILARAWIKKNLRMMPT